MRRRLGSSVEEGVDGGFAVHAASLVRAFAIVCSEESIEIFLHFDDVLVEFGAALDAEVLVEQGSVEAFEESVALRASDLGRAVRDAFELQEQFVRVLVGSAAELAAIVREHGLDGGFVFFKEGQDVVVEQVDGSERQ